MVFKPATKEKSKLRLALMGPAGSGKTFTALTFAQELGKKIAVIDSERGSASKYADLFKFDTCDLESHSPQTFVETIKEAEKAGYDVLIIDSLSHAWAGKDGALEQVDKAAKRSQKGNSFMAWREVTPHHNALVDAILSSRCHVIATMRTKQEYIIEENEKGRKVPRKIGMAPVQREGVEYEFDVIADMNLDHDLIVAKTRCHLLDGFVGRKPGKDFASKLLAWLDAGAAPIAPKQQSATPLIGGSAATADVSTTTEKTPANAAEGEAKKSVASDAGSSKKTAGKPVGTTDPKLSTSSESGSTPVSDTTSGTETENGGESGTPAGKPAGAQKVGAEQMQQLLAAGIANGWTRGQLSEFVCHAFKLKPETLMSTITWKQWETAVKLVSRPENAGGNVTVSADGKQLADAHRWPKAAAKEQTT